MLKFDVLCEKFIMNILKTGTLKLHIQMKPLCAFYRIVNMRSDFLFICIKFYSLVQTDNNYRRIKFQLFCISYRDKAKQLGNGNFDTFSVFCVVLRQLLTKLSAQTADQIETMDQLPHPLRDSYVIVQARQPTQCITQFALQLTRGRPYKANAINGQVANKI